MKKKPEPPKPKQRATHITLRVNARDLKRIRLQAKLFTDGNVSEMLRFGALNYRKLEEDFL